MIAHSLSVTVCCRRVLNRGNNSGTGAAATNISFHVTNNLSTQMCKAEEHGNNDAGDVEIEATEAEASRHVLDEEGHEQAAKEATTSETSWSTFLPS